MIRFGSHIFMSWQQILLNIHTVTIVGIMNQTVRLIFWFESLKNWNECDIGKKVHLLLVASYNLFVQCMYTYLTKHNVFKIYM